MEGKGCSQFPICGAEGDSEEAAASMTRTAVGSNGKGRGRVSAQKQKRKKETHRYSTRCSLHDQEGTLKYRWSSY